MRGSSITTPYRVLAAGLLAAGFAASALAQGAGAPPRSVEAAQTEASEPAAAAAEARPGDRATFIVRLHDAPAARYRGGLPGMPATSRQATGAERFRADTPDVRAYRGYLRTRQQEVIDGIRQQLGVDLDPERRWQLALNGFAVELDRRTARRLEALPEIAAVNEEVERVPLTFAGPDYIGAPALWTGSVPGGLSTRGEDTVIAVVDSGIRASHEAFAETAADGYSHTNPLGDGNFIGVCDPNHPDYDDQYPCNNKLIGAFHFNGDSADDQDGHGTHVAGTAAGNPVTTPEGAELSGVAPRANLINYRICAPGCSGMVDVAEDILARGDLVDIVNYSIGPQNGGGDAYGDTDSQAFLSLHEAGILVFAAGGNAGPTESSISNFAPWNVTVGSSDHGGRLSRNLTVTGPGTPPAHLEDIFALPSEDFSLASDLNGDAVLVESVDAGNDQACDPLPANSLDGVIGVAEAGGCDFEFKSEHMADAGAIGMILYSGQDYGTHFVMGGTFPIPSVWIDFPEHADFLTWLQDNPDSTVRIDADPTLVYRRPDVMSDFSARGPANNIYRELPGPDLVAAGDSILAPFTGADDAYRRIGGTSMASPHAAGAGALLRALQPGWTPAELQSALMLTAVPDVLTEADGSAPTPFDQGSGRLDVAAAADAGLVMDETYARFVDADPDGGSLALHELNIPFLSRHECPVDGCSWTRTFTAVQDGSWTVTTEAADISIDVQPATFSLTAGETQTLTVTVTDVPEGWDWHFGRIRLSEDGGGAAEARLPVAVTPPPPPPVEGNVLDLDGLEVPGGRVNAKDVRLDVPEGHVQSVNWDISYQASEAGAGAWLDEYRMELVTPDGEAMLVGGDTGAEGAPPDEALDHSLGWPSTGGTATDARSVDDFSGTPSAGVWTLRLYGTYALQPHGVLTDGARLEVAYGVAPLRFSPAGGDFETGDTVEVTIESASDSSRIVYTTNGSEPARDNGTVYQRGEAISVDAETELKAFAYDPDGSLADAPVETAVFAFHDPLAVVDGDGDAAASDAAQPGQPLDLTIEGGSGDFSVEAMPNPISGVTPRVTLEDRQVTLTVPDTGAFAGRYELVVTDEGTGRTTTVVFEVGLQFEADATHLFPGDSVTVQVLGAIAGYGMAFAIEGSEGHPSTAATVDPATDEAADDEAAANPAETEVSIGELSETERFSLAVTPEDGTYGPVSLAMSGDPGRFYSGWVQDEFGDPLSAEVATAEPVGPAEAIYAAPAGEDGTFRLQTPLPPDGEEHELSVSRPGYVTNRHAGEPCVGEEPQCTLTVYEATAALSGTVSGLAEGDRVRLYLATTGPDGEALELGPEIVAGEGNETEPFHLDASHRSSYDEIRGRGFGYRDFSANDNGAPFRFAGEGDEIDGIELEAVPTSPAVEQLTVIDSGRDAATVRLRIHPRERDGRVTLRYGEGPDDLDRSLDAVAVEAGDGWQTLEFELAELGCGTQWHIQATAENDRNQTGESGTVAFRTTACDGPEEDSSSCSLGAGTARLDPLLPALALLALFGLAGRRRRG